MLERSRFLASLTSHSLLKSLGALGLLLIQIAPVVAQRSVIIDPTLATIDLPADRTLERGIDRARDRISAGEFSQAIQFLDEVLAGEQDSFIATGDSGEHVGLKETASEMIRDLPPAGREMYKTLFGPVARKKLNQAVAAGDLLQLRKVAQQYFYTPAGYEAAMLVAHYEADAGRHLSANLLYEQLLATPDAAKRLNPQLSLLAAKSYLALGEKKLAEGILDSIGTSADGTAKIAGRVEQLDTIASDSVGWYAKTVGMPSRRGALPVDQWLMPRGNAARNGVSSGGLPHMRVRWEARLLSHPQFEAIQKELWDAAEERGKPLPPAGSPLAIGDTVITTTAHNVVAVDFRTGKRIWQTQPQRITEFEQLIGAVGSSGQIDMNMQQAQLFARRIWDDYLYSSVSSDGERVFVIRDLKLPDFSDADVWAPPFGVGGTEIRTFANRLCAYDLATQGKLVWEIDGAINEGQLAGAYFLGAPVVVDKYLYALVEIKSAIHLVAIEAQTGTVTWLQQLAGLQNAIYLDPVRRMQASMPSYDSGMLVCPTGGGVVIGINLEKRALAWAYQYETNSSPFAGIHRQNGRMVEQVGQSIEGTPVISNGYVLLAPPESNTIHCIDLMTGKVRWKRDRGDSMFVAGVQNHRALVIGLRGYTALDIRTGETLWEPAVNAWPPSTAPSGKGFFSNGKYYLPLSNAEVVAIDVEAGGIVDRAKSRNEIVLGNLVSHQGAILSQNGRFLDCFDQIDVLRENTERRLAEDADDFDALRVLGELTYNEGKLAKAIELLERAYELAPEDSRVREVLGECLLEAVQQDFSAYHDRLPQLRKIVAETPTKALTLLRIEAQGLLDLGKPLEAFDVCLKIHQDTAGNRELVPLSNDHQAIPASWLAAQVAAIWKDSSSEDRKVISDRIEGVLQEVSGNEVERNRFIETFGTLGNVAADELMAKAESLFKGKQLLAAQQMLLGYAKAPGKHQGEAIALNSQLLHEHPRDLGRLARPWDDLLETEFAEEKCLDGRTGSACLESWRKNVPIDTLGWPYGAVKVDQPAQENSTVAPRAQVPLTEARLEHSDEVLDRCNVFFSMRVGELLIRDPYGREIFREILGDEEKQLFDPNGLYAVTRGNLLVLSLGQQIVAIDTLRSATDGPIVLWRKSTVRNSVDRFRFQGHNLPGGIERAGSYRPHRAQEAGRWVGVLGPITRRGIVYQDQRGLCCVDPLTGEFLWSRTDTPNACQLFGDDEVVVAVVEGSKTAQVYSTLDGRSLGNIEVPRWQDQLVTRGTEVVEWKRNANGEVVLSCRDVMTDKDAWGKVYSRGSQVDVARNRYVAVVEPSGHYEILDSVDGKTFVDYKSEAIPLLRKVHLFAGTDQFVVGTEVARQSSSQGGPMQFSVFDFVVFDGQLMAFDAKRGTPLWSRPAEIRRESLMLAQPVDLPVIMFVGLQRRQEANGTHQFVDMLVLEKSSGRVLFSDDSLPQSPNHCVAVANPDSSEMLVDMINRKIHMKFTDEPRAPEPPATFEAAPDQTDGPKGLYRILQRFGGGI